MAWTPMRDRVVHAATAMLLQPDLERSLRPEVYSRCGGGGQHRAGIELVRLLRRHRWFLPLDVRAYFPSVHPDLVLGLLARRVDDGAFLEVVRKILATGPPLYARKEVRRFLGLEQGWPSQGSGLPLGAWTSQLVASHLVLAAMDHRVLRSLKVPGYLRYADDVFLFGPCRRRLVRARDELGQWLREERGMRWKNPVASPQRTTSPLRALGMLVSRDGIAPTGRSKRRLRRRATDAIWAGDDAGLQRSMYASVATLLFGAETGAERLRPAATLAAKSDLAGFLVDSRLH